MIWPLTFEDRLQTWADLRSQVQTMELEPALKKINAWWFNSPWKPYYLHWDDRAHWPDPWQLLVENTYCEVARALGICYTLLLTGVKDINLVQATDKIGDDVTLVLVDNAKYILSYHPNTVLSNTLKDFNIKRHVDISHIQSKL